MSEENQEVEETKPEPNDKDAVRRAEQIEELNEYVRQMAYTPVKAPLAPPRTESLAATKKKNILGTYVEHKDDLKPKERSERVGRMISKYKTITTEQLEELILQHRKKQSKTEANNKQKQILYHDTLTRLQKQCEKQLMSLIVNKFAKQVVKKAMILPPSNFETESYQSLHKAIVCNMYLALKVPNTEFQFQEMIFNKLAAVFADLILQALFLAQSEEAQTFEGEIEPEQKKVDPSEKDRCIKLRALRAAKKRLYNKRTRKLGCTGFSHLYSS